MVAASVLRVGAVVIVFLVKTTHTPTKIASTIARQANTTPAIAMPFVFDAAAVGVADVVVVAVVDGAVVTSLSVV